MQIVSSGAELAASHASFQRLERRDTERAWMGTRRPDFDARPTRADISDAGQAAAADPAKASEEAVENDPRLQLLRAMLWLFFGEELPPPRLREAHAAETEAPRPAAEPPPADAAPEIERVVEQTRIAFEHTSFLAEGLVRTADGRELHFERQMELTHFEFEWSREEVPAMKDPLVLNFNGPAAALGGPRWDFDLDADGQTESLPGLGHGSGWLVFDRNQDGRVNNGHELFGPRSGHGFAELAQLDADANGWIDEADPAWGGLGVWRPGGELQTLAEAGVGALSLANLATPFGLRGRDGTPQGQLRSSGFYLHEDGRPGSLQQVDLKV